VFTHLQPEELLPPCSDLINLILGQAAVELPQKCCGGLESNAISSAVVEDFGVIS
jgi:hypothetical protein